MSGLRTHNVCWSLNRGPMLWGLPIMQLGTVLGSAFMGFFFVKGMFGMKVGLLWFAIHGAAYYVLSFLAKKDPMYLTMLLFSLSARFYPRLTSYEVCQKRVEWRRQ